MNNKGFTLTELLAVIVILGIIVIIAFPAYSSVSESVKKSNLDTTISILEKTVNNYANKYLIDDIKPFNNSNGKCYYYSIRYILSENIFQSSNNKIINPVTNQELTGFVKVYYDTTNFTLKSEYKETKASADASCTEVDA